MTCHAGSRHLPPSARVHPRGPWRVPLLGRPRPRDLRGQGQEPAPTPELLLRRPRQPAPADPADGHDRRPGPVDGGRHRGGGAPARVQLDQGVRPAVQRPLPRRQDVPCARRHDERGVPAAARLPRAPAQRRALLRAVRARVGHPRDAGPAPARLPRAHLLRGRVQAARPDRASLSAGLHRQVLRAVRRPGRRRRAPPDRGGLLRLPRGPHGPPHPTVGAADGTGVGGAGVRAGRSAARRRRRAAPRHGAAGGGARRRHRRRCRRVRRRRARGRGPGLPRAWREGARPARLGDRQGGADRHRAPRRTVPHAVLRRAGGAGRGQRRRAPAGTEGDHRPGAAPRARLARPNGSPASVGRG